MGLLPPVASFAHRDFRGHMLQHLLPGMYAPRALVLGAPVTPLLRALPAPRARRLATVLRSGPVRLPGHPVPALPLPTGTLPVLYFSEVRYYGGDIAELLLAAALVATWRPAHRTLGTRRPGRSGGRVRLGGRRVAR